MEATKWYVRNTAGKVFGPIDLETLKGWVREGRVEPLAGVSSDLSNWVVAPQMPELEMNWVVENNAGQFYGPTHRAVLDDLVKTGTLSPSARFFLDDRGAAEERVHALESALAEHEKLKSDCDAEIAKRDAEIAKRDEEIAKRDAEIAKRDAEIATRDEQMANRDAEIAALKEQLAKNSEVHEREWKTEVVVPEVVVNEPPPPVARQAFASPSQSALAELERRAQQELARMGPSGVKKLFRLKK